MVYTSLSLSLAVLEVFVHLDPAEEPRDLVSIESALPGVEAEMERIGEEELPSDWRTLDNPQLQEIGADWVRSQRSLVLLVPSVVVAGEWNALLNPLHREASRIQTHEPLPFEFDGRMFKEKPRRARS